MKLLNILIQASPKDYDIEVLEEMLGAKSKTLRDGETRVFTQALLDETQLDDDTSAQDLAEAILATYDAKLLEKKIEKVVEEAMAYGNGIIKRYGAKNILAGKSDEAIDQILIDLAGIINALVSGSLKSAKRQAEAFTPTADVPQEDIDWFIAELDKYLGA